MDEKKHVKVLFKHDAFDKESIESAWANYENGEYKLDNILFYAKEYSIGDTLKIESYNDELYVTGLVQESGHSTVRVLLSEATMVPLVRKELKAMGCDSELSNYEKLISVDIPTSVNYIQLVKYLENGEETGVWEYEEACISTFHSSQIPQ